MKKNLLLSIVIFFSACLFAQENIQITNTPTDGYFKPLDIVKVKLPYKGQVVAKDAKGRIYYAADSEIEAAFFVSGSPGLHTVSITDKKGCPLTLASFQVDCETEINDNGGQWNQLFKYLKWNIYKPTEYKVVRYENEPYFLLSDWLRDHVNILKGKKYFFSEVKQCIDLFAENQAGNGMVFDFYMPAGENFWADRFYNKEFIDLRLEEGHVFQRVPVENDVEFWFVMGLYQTWKATEDSLWMQKWLPNAEKALKYDMESEFVWSEKYQLLKRPLTIDTWDFMPTEDAAVVGGDIMESIPGKSRYGIMHGDNTGFAAACNMLAEMFESIGETKKAQHWRLTAKEILERLDRVSWNGDFYTHFVDESPVQRDLGVDMSLQVSLSNTYALNRGISHENAVKIIETYQKIREEMPESSPGEFYGIYPPFQKGFHFQPWHYVNGGVFPFVAGELAKGSFAHGYEEYGVDILLRVKELLDNNDGEFPYYWIGKIPERPATNYTQVSIKENANVDFLGQKKEGVVGWTGEGIENDLSDMPVGKQIFHDVPFDVINPAANNRNACIGLSADSMYKKTDTVTVNGSAKSIYFLHTLAGRGNGMAGWFDLVYKDGTQHRKYINNGKELANWWGPTDGPYSRATGWSYKKAWSYHNGKANVGVYVYGYDNPYPEKEIEKIVFNHSMLNNKWFILGITLSDQPAYFEWPWKHGSWLVNWNTGCLISAYIEGLAGVYDVGVSYDKVKLCPRWSATSSNDVRVIAKYAYSNNYAAYHLTRLKEKIILRTAGVAEEINVEMLLPPGSEASKVKMDGDELLFETKTIENSSYAVFNVEGLNYKHIEVFLK